jgi:hypothetical protein
VTPDSPAKGGSKSGDSKEPGKGGGTKGSSDSETKKTDDGKKGSSEVKKTDDGKKGSSGSSGSGSVRGVVTIGEVEVVPDVVEERDLPGGDPNTDPGGRGGGDVGARNRLPRHPRITQQQRDLVGRAFGTATGADDKERPVVGGTSGSVSTNPSESRADDVGGLHAPRPGGGGEAGSAFEALLRSLGLWEKWQAGGPDPPK